MRVLDLCLSVGTGSVAFAVRQVAFDCGLLTFMPYIYFYYNKSLPGAVQVIMDASD